MPTFAFGLGSTLTDISPPSPNVPRGDGYTDLAFARDEEGLYDLVLDEANRDMKVTQGLESAVMVSLFSDRRAAADEVSDPLRRRGWIGNLVAEVNGDNHGSGLWLYDQRRLTPAVATGIRREAEAALEWMREEQLASTVSAQVVSDPAKRSARLVVGVADPVGTTAQKARSLIERTRRGLVVQTF